MEATPGSLGDDWLVEEDLLAAPSNWGDDVKWVDCWLTPHYCSALDDCGSDDDDDLMTHHDDSC